MQQNKWVVFYDGQCPLCSWEMALYARRDHNDILRLVDISDEFFDAAFEGLDPERIHARFHVRRPDGQLVIGVDGFAAIWDALGMWPLAVACARNRLLRLPLDLAYVCFAKIRPYFRRGLCKGTCSIS